MDKLIDNKLEERLVQERESQKKEMDKIYNKKLEEKLAQE